MATIGIGIQNASFDQGAAGTTDLIAAPGAGKVIKVLGYVIASSAAGTVKLIDSTPTDITGAMPIAANGSIVVQGRHQVGVCAANTKLQLVSATGACKGNVTYIIDSA